MPETGGGGGTGGRGGKKILVWVTDETWRAAVDAVADLAPEPSSVTLLHVTPSDPPDVAHAAYLGLLGRGRPAVIRGPASPASPRPQPPNCSTPRPGAWAARVSGSPVRAGSSVRWWPRRAPTC